MRNATAVNATLRAADDEVRLRVLSPTLQFWSAENLLLDAQFPAAAAACADLRERFPETVWAEESHLLEAQAHVRLGDVDAALGVYDLAAHGESVVAHRARFEHGALLERQNRRAEAEVSFRDLLRRRPSESLGSWFDRIEDAAERRIKRCIGQPSPGCPSPRDVAFRLARALREKDMAALRALSSPTHFAVGITESSYLGFDAIADGLRDALGRSAVVADPTRLDLSGGTVGLVTTGWSPANPIDRIVFQISEEPSGWSWTGVTPSGPGFMPKLDPGDPPPFPRPHPGGPPGPPQPPFVLKAPWPSGQCFHAGGIGRYLESFIPIWGWFIVLADMSGDCGYSDCGYGAYGLYYGQWPTHQGKDYYAVDFTAYTRFLHYASRVPYTEALAAHYGVVTDAYGDTPYGLHSGYPNNFVNLEYLTPSQVAAYLNAPPGTDFSERLPQGPSGVRGGEWRTRYLHLGQGLYVSKGMLLSAGVPLGLMDDTGNSSLPHLHFSLHSRDLVIDGTPYYSVPLLQFDQTSLGANNAGDCVCSSNSGPIWPPG